MDESLNIHGVPADSASSTPARAAVVLLLGLAALAGAELLSAIGQVVASALAHALLVALLLTYSAATHSVVLRRAVAALALLPLLRVLSLALPIQIAGQFYSLALVGALLLVAVGVAAGVFGLPSARIGLRRAPWPAQLLIAASGVPLGLAAFVLLPAQSLFPIHSWIGGAAVAVILLVFTGFAEELLFRGLLLRVWSEVFGGWSVLLTGAAFAIMYVGAAPWIYVLFVALAGLFFGWCAYATGSLWGAIVAHGLTNVGLVCVWPFAGGWLGVAPGEGFAGVGQVAICLSAITYAGCVAMALAWLRLAAVARPPDRRRR